MTSVYIVDVCTISMINTRNSVDNCIQWVGTNAIQIQVRICFLINFSYYCTENKRQVFNENEAILFQLGFGLTFNCDNC